MKKIILVLSLLALILFVAADTGEYEYEEDDDNAYGDDTSKDELPEPIPMAPTSGTGERAIPSRFDPNKSDKKNMGAIRERRSADTNHIFNKLASEERPTNAVINSLSPIVALWAVSAENQNPTTPSD